MKYRTGIKGKKAILGSTIADFWSYVIFVFIVLIFFVFFNLQSSRTIENRIESFDGQANMDLTLINFLRLPIEVTIDKKIWKMTMGKLVIEYYLDLVDDSERFDMDKIVKEHLSKVPYDNRRLMIIFKDELLEEGGPCWYDSQGKECWGRISFSYLEAPEAVMILPIPIGSKDIGFEYIEVVLR